MHSNDKSASVRKDQLVYVGKLGKSVGLKGQLKIFIDTDFPEQFKKSASFMTNKKIKLTIESVDLARGIVKFEGINDVEEAKRLTNQQLYTTLENTREQCELGQEQYFWFDIIGCNILEGDKLLGRVKDIHRYPVTDYLEVSTESILIEQGLPKSFLIPYDPNFILEVDMDNKTIKCSRAQDILQNS